MHAGVKILFGFSVFLLTMGLVSHSDWPQFFLLTAALAFPGVLIPSRPFQIVAGAVVAIALGLGLYQYLHPS
jgi:hypothetical protein